MRYHVVLAAVGVACVALLSLGLEGARACEPRFYGGPIYYRPTAVYYVQPYNASPQYFPPAYTPGFSAARPTTNISVAAYDNYFQPNAINVQPGTTVRFVNSGRHTHTVTSTDGRFDSGDLAPGATYTVTFKNPGTFSYYCRHHSREMQGSIVVGGASAAYSGAPRY